METSTQHQQSETPLSSSSQAYVARLFLHTQDLGQALDFAINVELRGVKLVAQTLELRGTVLGFELAALGVLELALLALFFESLLLFGLDARVLLFLQPAL